MKVKATRHVIGTFAEVGTLIRSFSQLFFDYIKDPNDEYWLWMIEIRKYLRYLLMPQISDSQVFSAFIAKKVLESRASKNIKRVFNSNQGLFVCLFVCLFV